MAASFSLTGQVRLTPRWTDELNATDVIDATSIIESFALTNGTGSGQANCYWKDVRTVAGNSVDTIDLMVVPLKAYGGTANVNFTNLRMIYVKNRHASASLLFAVPDFEFSIVAGGMFLWFAPTNASSTPAATFSSGSKSIAITNGNANSIDYEIILVGVKA